MADNQEKYSLADGRAILSRFSKAQPMYVPPYMFAALKKVEGLEDMIDRVRPTALLPLK